jgi:molybdopterin synthase sulfur carrier subunit
MKVSIPTPLRSYTNGAAEVGASGTTLAEVLDDLDRAHPGIRFRMIDEQGGIRRHMKIFINRERVAGLDEALRESDEIQILQSLSGG